MGKKDAYKIKDEFLDFEYKSIVFLFDYLAAKDEGNELDHRRQRLRNSRNAIRIAFRKNTSIFKPHGVPPQLLADEQKTIYEAVKYARKYYPSSGQKLKDFDIVYRIGKTTEIRKPVPLPVSKACSDIDEKSFLGIEGELTELEEVTNQLTAERFYRRGETVRKNVDDYKKALSNFKATPLIQRLLATCFLEMSSYKDKDKKILAKILDALYSSGYHKFKLYHLIQWAQQNEEALCLRKWEYSEIDKLCGISKKSKPFSKLVK